jgi:hypothetical protein
MENFRTEVWLVMRADCGHRGLIYAIYVVARAVVLEWLAPVVCRLLGHDWCEDVISAERGMLVCARCGIEREVHWS